METLDRAVFVDSNYFVAFFNPADALHAQAVARGNDLRTANPQLVISNFVFSETVTILSQRAGRFSALQAGREILDIPGLRMVHVDEQLQEESWRIFQEIERKDTSFVDCSTVAVMRAEHIGTLLTFDRDDFAPLRGRYRFKFFEDRTA